MRVFICAIPLLCGCSSPAVRCDAHLQPINPPAARDTPSATAAPGAAATPGVKENVASVQRATVQDAAVPAAAARSAP